MGEVIRKGAAVDAIIAEMRMTLSRAASRRHAAKSYRAKVEAARMSRA